MFLAGVVHVTKSPSADDQPCVEYSRRSRGVGSALAVVVDVLPAVTLAPIMGTPAVSFATTMVAVPFLTTLDLLADTCGGEPGLLGSHEATRRRMADPVC